MVNGEVRQNEHTLQSEAASKSSATLIRVLCACGAALLMCLVVVGVFVYRRKMKAKRFNDDKDALGTAADAVEIGKSGVAGHTIVACKDSDDEEEEEEGEEKKDVVVNDEEETGTLI